MNFKSELAPKGLQFNPADFVISEKYANIGRKYGASVPFLRSKENSEDTSSSWDVVLEVLKKYKEKGMYFDTICLLQPTSPLRESKDILAGYELLKTKHADSITSVCAVDHSPLWTMVLDKDLSLSEFRRHLKEVPRQQLDKYYRLNGAIYIKRIKYDKDIVLIDDNEYAVIMDYHNSVDIDTIEDFELAEWYINKLKNKGDKF